MAAMKKKAFLFDLDNTIYSLYSVDLQKIASYQLLVALL
jgi:FMN phosphatase YigB (HAD superfamily)